MEESYTLHHKETFTNAEPQLPRRLADGLMLDYEIAIAKSAAW
jgi:hypothetical protein